MGIGSQRPQRNGSNQSTVPNPSMASFDQRGMIHPQSHQARVV